MVKVRGKGEHRMEALRLADAFRARVIDASTESFVFEITGASEKIESFVALMLPLGLVEVSRTGIVAIGRGTGGDVTFRHGRLTPGRDEPLDFRRRLPFVRAEFVTAWNMEKDRGKCVSITIATPTST